jgi:hypothetical protein
MTTKAFVEACRGPEDTPADISPLSWLKTAIISLDDLPRLVKESAEDPDAYWTMVGELVRLHANLTAALAEHDATTFTMPPGSRSCSSSPRIRLTANPSILSGYRIARNGSRASISDGRC